MIILLGFQIGLYSFHFLITSDGQTADEFLDFSFDLANTQIRTDIMSETDPLMPSNASGNESSWYYFLNKPATPTSSNLLVRDNDGGVVVESAPPGTQEEEFAPRVLPPVVSITVW